MVKIFGAMLYDKENNKVFEEALIYEINIEGVIKFSLSLIPGKGLPEIPEIGIIFLLDETYSNLKWYGRGPHESY